MRKLFVPVVVLLLVSSSGLRHSNAQDNQRDRSRGDGSNGSENWSQAWSDWWSDWSSDNEASTGDQKHRKSGAQEFIRRHDSDEDGQLSRRELPARMRSDFDRLDRNQNEMRDTLTKIARKHYGNNDFQPIFRANVHILDDPDVIRVGQVLRVPIGS